ncbi:flocculation protein FLO11-like [Strongylocentrotus purpuratus]|uniref:Uncharacterized protein n=1 Tax=Strongylocentrotus purpuratus TaxID=7668 RepID=A0A7M7NUL9_STRPU|nr:flocculation protein FLO11-like [Strongylocentrotus purpuratus]
MPIHVTPTKHRQTPANQHTAERPRHMITLSHVIMEREIPTIRQPPDQATKRQSSANATLTVQSTGTSASNPPTESTSSPSSTPSSTEPVTVPSTGTSASYPPTDSTSSPSSTPSSTEPATVPTTGTSASNPPTESMSLPSSTPSSTEPVSNHVTDGYKSSPMDAVIGIDTLPKDSNERIDLDSNPGPLVYETTALPRSHRSLK